MDKAKEVKKVDDKNKKKSKGFSIFGLKITKIQKKEVKTKVKKEKPFTKEKFSDVVKKERREHAMIIFSTVVIVLLLLFIGYSMYTFYKTKAETTSQIYSLNGTIVNLSEEKNQLLFNNSNLTEELNNLRESVKGLTNQKTLLVVEKSELEDKNAKLQDDLDTCQTDYDKKSDDLKAAQSDLDDCKASCP